MSLETINNKFYSDIGFKDEAGLKSIHRFFGVENGSAVKKILSSLEARIHRIIHFFKTGVWIDAHSIGQSLNQHRFRSGVRPENIASIEAIFGRALGSAFIQNAYDAATKETTLESLQNSVSFFLQFLKSPTTVGSLLPSSGKLAKGIVAQIPGPDMSGAARRYLEVGPGTGTFTAELIRKLRAEDTLHLVEYDQRFVDVLRRRFGHLKNVKILQKDFTQFNTIHKIDYCVSGLPLAAFSKEFVGKVYGVFDRVVKKGGKIAYFEYMGLPSLKQSLLRGKEREDFDGVLQQKEKYYQSHNGSLENIWLNVTPARVCRVTV